MRWPGKIPAGQMQDELCSTMDLLPTLAKLADAALPLQPIDGHDIRPPGRVRARVPDVPMRTAGGVPPVR
jgi:arylsulfatase A-like enzyme